MLGASRMMLADAGRHATLASRTFHTSARRMAASAPLPPRKPLGAFRGGIFGFLFGTVLSGTAVYTYLIQEYKAANDLLAEDIYTLQASVTRLTNYVHSLESKVQENKK